jgi:hypothetical protein
MRDGSLCSCGTSCLIRPADAPLKTLTLLKYASNARSLKLSERLLRTLGGRATTTPRSRGATPREPPTNDATSTPRFRTAAGHTSMAMVFMESVRSEADRPEAYDGASLDPAWESRGIMAKDILPDRPPDRRRRSRLCALRAMDRLGMLGEENLLPTLARRPHLRWLADEEGARWDILRELGRIGDPDTFEDAVEWMLENHPSPEEAKTYIHRRRACARRPDDARSVGRRIDPGAR